MTDLRPISAEAQMILSELHALRDEMVSMHQETHATLIAIREMFDELRRVERTESDIEQELEDVSHRLGDALGGQQPSLTTCSVCGSDLERHAAENGILLICNACGHTAFAERRTNGERRIGHERSIPGRGVTEELSAPEGDNSFDWTGT